jgi:hypothetical protein
MKEGIVISPCPIAIVGIGTLSQVRRIHLASGAIFF